jgi:hypothetical protein
VGLAEDLHTDCERAEEDRLGFGIFFLLREKLAHSRAHVRDVRMVGAELSAQSLHRFRVGAAGGLEVSARHVDGGHVRERSRHRLRVVAERLSAHREDDLEVASRQVQLLFAEIDVAEVLARRRDRGMVLPEN